MSRWCRQVSNFSLGSRKVTRPWSEQDLDYKADVRIGFQATGY